MNNEQVNVDSIQNELSEQEQIRRDKLSELIKNGKNPYSITSFPVDNSSKNILDNFEEFENKVVNIAGRIMSKRVMGKAAFVHILDGEGQIQAYIRRDDVGVESYQDFKAMDIGDIVGINGFVFRTQKGEISVHSNSISLLCKGLKPLPEKFHGLKDQDLRYRQRYLDMIVNPEVKDVFIKRSKILAAIREFLDSRGFVEVDTPVLHTLEIGAAARPFKTHHNALDIDMFLRIETELYLKRLIVGGMNKVYEVGRIFRNEGMDATHNPEFTSVETYEAYADYKDVMHMVEELYDFIAMKACGTTEIPCGDTIINLKSPWPRLTMVDAVKQYAGVDYNDWQNDADAVSCAKAHGLEVDDKLTKGDVLAEFFDAYVEDKLVQPIFIMDYPVAISPLAKRKQDNPEFTERFEFFINCQEMGNAFSELNDPIDQRNRFESQVAKKNAEGANASVDEDFLNALEYGMPPTGGLGFGVDRLVMLLTNQPTIRDVLLFPTMKPIGKEDEANQGF
ncbi:MAG: lysine--tRNA ligase [Eubacteriales bacterium]|nr:lysine--tRNA ligase [Eubacteriales bacterium]